MLFLRNFSPVLNEKKVKLGSFSLISWDREAGLLSFSYPSSFFGGGWILKSIVWKENNDCPASHLSSTVVNRWINEKLVRWKINKLTLTAQLWPNTFMIRKYANCNACAWVATRHGGQPDLYYGTEIFGHLHPGQQVGSFAKETLQSWSPLARGWKRNTSCVSTTCFGFILKDSWQSASGCCQGFRAAQGAQVGTTRAWKQKTCFACRRATFEERGKPSQKWM